MNKVLMCEYLDIDTVFQVGSHYYAKNFVRDGDSIEWINQPKPFFNKNLESVKVINEKIRVINPKVFLPFCKYPLLNTRYWANNYLKPFVNKQVTLQEVDLLWMTNVKMMKLADSIKYGKMVHRMADDFSGFSGAYKNMLYLQKEVIRKSDAVLVSAKNLVDIAYKENKNVLYLPNGVDITRFNNSSNNEIPKEYENINGPKVVYVGAIEDWFDYNLILNTAKKLKDISFIMVGNKSAKSEEIFKGQSNIHLLGKKTHDEIVSYLHYADIGIMPFIDNKLTNSIHPLKLYEYFAAGLPVISRDLEEVREMKSPALLYSNENQFIEYIKDILKMSKNTSVYKDYAAKNTWENRYKQMKEYLNLERG